LVQSSTHKIPATIRPRPRRPVKLRDFKLSNNYQVTFTNVILNIDL